MKIFVVVYAESNFDIVGKDALFLSFESAQKFVESWLSDKMVIVEMDVRE